MDKYMHEILFVLQAFAVIAGCLFIYAGGFLYTDQRKKLQSRLDDYWLNTAIKKDEYDGVLLSALDNSVQYFSKWFDQLFGVKLFSRQSIITSVLLSVSLSPVIALFGAVLFYISTTEKNKLIIDPNWLIWLLSLILFAVWFRYILYSVTCKTFVNAYQRSIVNYIGNILVLFSFSFFLWVS